LPVGSSILTVLIVAGVVIVIMLVLLVKILYPDFWTRICGGGDSEPPGMDDVC
jgi:hypothetical protein